MDNNLKNILIVLAVVVVLAVVIRGCQGFKEVKFKQRSNDDSTKLSIDIKDTK